MMRAAFLSAASLLFALGCGGNLVKGVGAPFSETWQSDQGKSIAALEARLRDSKAPGAAAVAVGVNDSGLYGV
ncbi:MAG TPA: hypothetical protein VEQ58_15070, partial [Polyangiaceae bacterium]|nr:hypothetical protein [Polyangiaceae bacterium]